LKFEGKSRRLRERLPLNLPVRVQCQESLQHQWVEMSRLIDVTPFGARFTITRPTEPGRLLYLTLPMPRQLRCFDHVEDQYRVWSLVRSLRAIPAEKDKPPRYEVGVAFIGKHPPRSFLLDPKIRYEVASSATESGLYGLTERQDLSSPNVRRVDKPRPETRHFIPVEVTVEALDEDGRVAASEPTVTENISRRGAAVFSSLDIERGAFVRVISHQYQISVIAAVRGRRLGPDGIPRLHLEFIDRQWPLEGIE